MTTTRRDARGRLRPGRALVGPMLVAVLATAGLTACSTPQVATDGVQTGDRILPVATTSFAEPGLTWAQGRTIHYGEQTFTDVVDRDIIGLLRTPTGFFLRVVSDDDPLHEFDDVVYWDGETVTEVSAGIDTFEVSEDGRYAGWLERDVERERGGLAAIRVVDLTTGLAVVSTTEGMGDPDAGADELAELYANAWPNFAGFDDDDRAYWDRASDEVVSVRRDLETGQEEPSDDDEEGFPASMLWEGNRGYVALGPAAGDLPAPWPKLSGLVTPDEQVLLVETGPTPRIYRAQAPRRAVRLPTGFRFTQLGGWADLDEHRVVLLARDRRERGYDPAAPDRTTGAIVVCDVDEAVCDEPIAVSATRSVVFDDGLDRF